MVAAEAAVLAGSSGSCRQLGSSPAARPARPRAGCTGRRPSRRGTAPGSELVGMGGVSGHRQPSPSPGVVVGRCGWRGRPGGAQRGWCAGRPADGCGRRGERSPTPACWTWQRGFRCAAPPPPGAQGRVASARRARSASSPHPSARTGQLVAVERHNTGSRAGWPATGAGGRRPPAGGRPRVCAPGIPRPWRANALRSDGEVMPNSAAAAADAAQPLRELEGALGFGRSKKRVGSQPTRCWASRPHWSASAGARPAFGGGLALKVNVIG